MTYSAGKATRAYTSVGTHTSVESASPHRLIQLLLEGAMDKIAVAKGCMQREEVAGKAQLISRAMSIIDGLRMSLDTSVEHEITGNLDDLYDYMNRRLLYANMHNSVEALDEVFSLLSELREAWSAIADVDQPSSAENGEILQEMSS